MNNRAATSLCSLSAGERIRCEEKSPSATSRDRSTASTSTMIGKYRLDYREQFSGTVDLFPNSGKGIFRAPLVLSIGAPTAVDVAVGDLNGDGKPDIVGDRWAGLRSCVYCRNDCDLPTNFLFRNLDRVYRLHRLQNRVRAKCLIANGFCVLTKNLPSTRRINVDPRGGTGHTSAAISGRS